jgi:hypothetical protein
LSCPHPPSGRGSALLSPLLPNLCPVLTHHQVERQQSALLSPLLPNLCPVLTQHQVEGQQSTLLSPYLLNLCPIEINMPLQHKFCPNLFCDSIFKIQYTVHAQQEGLASGTQMRVLLVEQHERCK